MKVDLLTGPNGELLEGIEAAKAEGDVDGIGELGAHAASGLAGGSAAEVALLEKHYVRDACLREVEGDARSHDPAADDHHGRGIGQSVDRHPKLTPWARGSACE